MNTKTTGCGQALSPEFLERTADVLRLLAHPVRLKIVEILMREEEAPVHLISEGVDLPPAATSQHLNQMKRIGLVTSIRHGKEVWYQIDDIRCVKILQCIRQGGKQ